MLLSKYNNYTLLLLISREVHTVKSDRNLDVRTERNEVRTKTKARIFSRWNNWLTGTLLYSHHELKENFSESGRKMSGKLMKYHSKPIFVRIEQKRCNKDFTNSWNLR